MIRIGPRAMTSNRVPRPVRVPRRTTTVSAPVRRALVDALIGAVRDELDAVDVSRTKRANTKHATEKSPRVSAKG